MAEYYNVTTNIGDAEIANAIATATKLNITHIAFGDGNGAVPTPNKTRSALVHEVHRQAVTKYERHKTNANWLVIETIIPSNVGRFTIREMGIIANGKLISHGSHAPFEKVADPSGVSEYRLKFTQNITDGSVVEITLDESLIYASQAWVEENFIKRNEIVDNLITDDATKPISAKQAKNLQDNKLGKTENAVSATKLKDSRSITLTKGVTGTAYFDGSSNIQIEATVANLGVANGIATLDPTGKVPSNQLPSYVDDVLEYATTSDFPATGETGKIYLETTGNTTYRWSGSAYAKITSGEVSSVAGKNGVVTLVKADVGLGNVDNTADSNKSVASAAKLATARTIGGVSFDGSANINLPGVNAVGNQNTTGNAASATTAAACTGNAATATKLAAARKINGTAFDGTGDITVTDNTKAPLTDFASLKGVNGYQKISGGLIVQWGYFDSINVDAFAVTFPITFPNKCVFGAVQLNGSYIDQNVLSVPNQTKTGMGGTLPGAGNYPVNWFALGY